MGISCPISPLAAVVRAPPRRLPLATHLMIEQPERYIDFVRAGRTWSRCTEICPHLHRTLQQIREAGQARRHADPATLVTLEEVLDQVDLILVMTVNPGFGGQSLSLDVPKDSTTAADAG